MCSALDPMALGFAGWRAAFALEGRISHKSTLYQISYRKQLKSRVLRNFARASAPGVCFRGCIF